METTKAKTTDELVIELFNTVRSKQREISGYQKPSWETSCTIGYNPEIVSDRINIQTVTDINKLVDLVAFLRIKRDYWKEACDSLGVKVPFKWMGYEPVLWEKDIKARIDQLNLSVKQKELKALEARLDALITVDQRRVMELEAITKELATQ